MAEKILNTRIALKVDTLERWNASTLPLKKGELAFATVAATAGTGLTEPVVMVKIGEDGVKTFKDLAWNFYAKASDVVSACKSEASLKTFIANEIKVIDLDTNAEFKALADSVAILKGDAATAGSLAHAIAGVNADIEALEKYVGTIPNGEDGQPLAESVVAYVNKKTDGIATSGNLEALAGRVTAAEGEIDALQEASAKHALQADLEAVDAKFADYTKTADLPTDLGDFTNTAGYAKTADVNTALDKKADKTQVATDIANAVAPLATTEALNGVKTTAEAAAVKTEVEAALDLKANKADVEKMYTNTQIDGFIQDAKDYADANDAKYHVEYDSENKKIKLVAGADANKMEIDATAFIKDGMISNVTIGTDNDLVITFNTDAGKEDIVLPLDQLVDIYTGVAGDRITVSVSNDDKISADLVAGSISKNYLDTGVQASLGKADTALQEHQDISHLAVKTDVATDIAKAVKELADGAVADNAADIEDINDTLATYGDIVTRNASEFATAAQGALADTALQKADITTGNTNGTIKVGDTEVAVKGLGSAAYTESSAYDAAGAADAVATNLTKLETEKVNVNAAAIKTINDTLATHGDIVTHDVDEFATAAQGAKADSALQEITTTENGGLKVTNKNQIDIDETVVFVFDCGDSGVASN